MISFRENVLAFFYLIFSSCYFVFCLFNSEISFPTNSFNQFIHLFFTTYSTLSLFLINKKEIPGIVPISILAFLSFIWLTSYPHFFISNKFTHLIVLVNAYLNVVLINSFKIEKNILRIYFSIALVVCFYGFYQNIILYPYLKSQLTDSKVHNLFSLLPSKQILSTRLNTDRMISIFINPNHFGFFLVFSWISIMYSASFAQTNRKEQPFVFFYFLSTVAIILALIVCTQSKTTFFLCIFFSVILFLKKEKNYNFKILLAGLSCFSIFFILLNKKIISSLSTRFEYFLKSFILIKKNLLGYGVNSFPNLYINNLSGDEEITQFIHNHWLEHAFEKGLCSSLILLLFTSWIILKTIRVKTTYHIRTEENTNRFHLIFDYICIIPSLLILFILIPKGPHFNIFLILSLLISLPVILLRKITIWAFITHNKLKLASILLLYTFLFSNFEFILETSIGVFLFGTSLAISSSKVLLNTSKKIYIPIFSIIILHQTYSLMALYQYEELLELERNQNSKTIISKLNDLPLHLSPLKNIQHFELIKARALLSNSFTNHQINHNTFNFFSNLSNKYYSSFQIPHYIAKLILNLKTNDKKLLNFGFEQATLAQLRAPTHLRIKFTYARYVLSLGKTEEAKLLFKKLVQENKDKKNQYYFKLTNEQVEKIITLLEA